MAKRLEIASIPQPEKQATRNENQCSQIPSRPAPSEMTPRSEILLWTSAYLLPLKDEKKFSQQGHSKLSRSPKTTGSVQPTTSSVSMFHLRVPTVGVSNSRSLCLKTTECPKRVIDLLANSLHSMKGIWKNQTNFNRYDIDKNKLKGKST